MNTSRGSIWRKCDFHVHTPFSALSNEFGADFDVYVQKLFRKAIEKKINVIGITDYFTIEGYKKIRQDYLENEIKLKELFTEPEIFKIKQILLLANVEFRLNKIVQINKFEKDGKTKVESGRINFHVIFSDQLSVKTIEESFLHDLDFLYESDPDESDKRKKLKTVNLESLGARLKQEQPDLIGTSLRIGMTHAVVDDSKITDYLINNTDFKEKYLIVVPSDEDLSEIRFNQQDGLTRKLILAKANALFSSNAKTISFALGEKATSVEDFLGEFKSLKPCIWGSDAHDYDKLFEPDQQRNCFVKAGISFEGIRQILFEPHDRVFIGEYPPLFARIRASKSNYIDKINISNQPDYDGKKGVWFKDFELELGLELTAVIGNKGKGKSAIADIIALLGNSHIAKKDFSFLNSDKFCQKGYAENFSGTITWFDRSTSTRNLNENIDFNGVERIKYIPQSYLEKLCNTEDSNFKEEINKVVFSRLDDSDKLGKTSFADLEAYKTELLSRQIDQLIIKLGVINKHLDVLEQKVTPDYKQSIENQKVTKVNELDLHNKEKDTIVVVVNPDNDTSLSLEQRQKAEKVTKLSHEISGLEFEIEMEQSSLTVLKIKATDYENLILETNGLQRSFDDWKTQQQPLFEKYQFNINEIVSLNIDLKTVQEELRKVNHSISEVNTALYPVAAADPVNEKSLIVKLAKLQTEKTALEKELEKPFKDYQDYLVKIKDWETKQKAVIGAHDVPNTIKFYEAELAYINNALPKEIETQKDLRKQLTIDVYNQKKQIQEIYNKMKQAISVILEEYSAEQNITIESSFKVDKTFYTQFFDYVFRYGAFHNNGDEAIRKLISKYNFDIEDSINEFLTEIDTLDIRIKDNRKVDFFNYLCSLSYLKPEYDLRLNRKGLNQLSPGEKGGLLLVFYLVLDKDNKPLIIDQPEDNLDNQSVAEILVPYIKRAKKLRQIIMVTHNPNLAIVADAEQIVYMDIDKENNYVVSCDAGGIEDKVMNNHIVDILEGKMKAFDNRRVKYKKYPVLN
ncbi:TrlF family AAA-like ATPase [Mucilaginibacter sp.]|uniref:TrlF family AAA-like ATPase n=1 Tax=Mucilaginibacter sp. TaxID=1882438 RepID=UPI003B00BB70